MATTDANFGNPEYGYRSYERKKNFSHNDLGYLSSDNPIFRKKIFTLNLNSKKCSALIKMAEAGANAGVAEWAEVLSWMYGKQNFFHRVTTEYNETGQEHFGFPAEVHDDYDVHNPFYDSAKAKHWKRVAEHLQGLSSTPLERDKFLQDFLFSQNKTPEGLYNIGYALSYNQHIKDRDRGIDYLKHAANLGNANAANELGENYFRAFKASDNKRNLETAYFWYKIAASTPMKVADSEGKSTAPNGHPYAIEQITLLNNDYPELEHTQLQEAELRNPTANHIRQYPASMWFADIPVKDIADLVRNPEHGGILTRMQNAVHAIDEQVKEFEVMTGAIQAKIDDLIARQAVLDGRVEGLKGEEISALRHNDGMYAEQRKSERAIQISKDRWIKETATSLTGTIVAGYLTGGASFVSEALSFGSAGHVEGPGAYAANLLRSNKIRAAGYHAVMQNEVEHHQALIEELESRKIDTSQFPDEIHALALAIQEVADSAPVKKLMQDEVRSRSVIEGYLRQKILKSGLENCRFLEDYSRQQGIESVDEFLVFFENGYEDGRLHQALSNLCYGHANSNDMAVLLADVNAMRGDNLPPHEKALKRFVERVVKGNIGHYMTRASQIDVITDLHLIDFSTMNIDQNATSKDLMHGATDIGADEHASRQVDTATKLALTTMFSNQFGVTHIGQYDVTRMFTYFLHRHGKDELIAAELQDGQVTDEQKNKSVGNLKNPQEMKGFVERIKASALRGRETQPDVGDLFLRVCGYEYYLPQAVITSGRRNRFQENPEAPVAYPMVNRVVQSFIEKMSLTDITAYRQQVGGKLDSLIAQTFIDFFQQCGRDHAQKFAEERERLRDAHVNENYGPRFDAYEDKITDDILKRFPEFVKLYERNLAKELQGAPEPEAVLLQEQIASLHQNAKDYLAPAVPQPGSYQARQAARELDHRGTNMTEGWNFAS